MTNKNEVHISILEDIRGALDIIPAGIFLTDLPGRILYVNKEWCRITGLGENQAKGVSWTNVVYEEDKSFALELWETLLVNNERFEAELRFSCHNLKTRWVLCKAQPYVARDGKITGYLGKIIDIQKRKNAETKLEESRDFLQALYDASPDMIFLHGPDGKVLDVNQNTLDTYGYTLEEMTTLPFENFSGVGCSMEQARSYLESAGKGEKVDFEWMASRKDGVEFAVEVRLRRIADSDNSSNIVAVVRDIREQKLAQQALRSSEDRFRNLVEATSDWIWEADQDFKYTYVSPQVNNILGYDPSDLYEMTPFDLMRDDEASRIKAMFSNNRGDHQPFSCLENINLHKDGYEVVLETSGIPLFDDEGNFRGYRGIDRDITDRKIIEDARAAEIQRLENISRISLIFESTLDMDEMLKSVIEEVRLIFNCDRTFVLSPFIPTNSHVNVAYESISPDIEKSKANNSNIAATSGARSVLRNVVDVKRPVILNKGLIGKIANEGYEVPAAKAEMLMAMYPKSGDAWILGIQQYTHERKWTEPECALFHEISIRTASALSNLIYLRQSQEASEKLAEAQSQLMQTEKMASIGQLAAGVAHEINNPLGYVSSNISVLKEHLNDLFMLLNAYEDTISNGTTGIKDIGQLDTLKQKIDLTYLSQDIPNIISESEEGLARVKDIVRDMKDYSRVDSGIVWEYVDLSDLMDRALKIVWNELKYKAEIKKNYHKIPAIQCIPTQISQVIVNLLVNAAQSITTFGKIHLNLFLLTEGWVCIEIRDTGEGIPQDRIKKLFDPFFTTKPVGKGTGLGLSVSYKIINAHDGRIEVESHVGCGTSFKVHLPVAQS